MLRPGELLDQKYRIVTLLGRGGTGHVYLAENIKIGKKWAIKEVDLERESRTDLLAEVEILKKLDHSCLPTVVDLIEQENFLYIVESFFEGTTLKEIIANQQFCPEQNVIKWARELCEILIYLHEFKPNSIIYRDMKPANVIIDKENNAKLIDLGIAREYKDGQDGDTVYIGTRGYAAPEQYSGSYQTDARTDIYGLGATLYHALTGLNPAEPPYQLIPIKEVNNSISKDLENIIIKCTKNDPSMRYQHVRELLKDFDNIDNNFVSVKETENNIYHCFGTKLIMIGSLSHRAGSSFVAANLAAMLASSGISVSVVECPVNIPYFFDALFVREKNQNNFISWAHEIKRGYPVNRTQAYYDNGVSWVIVDPTKSSVRDWTLSDTMQLLYSVKQSQVILVDISLNLTHNSVRPILSQVDNLLIVVDPDPVLLDRTERIEDMTDVIDELSYPIELRIMKTLTDLITQADCCVDFIVNKHSQFIDIDQLCLPLPPITSLPYFEPSEVYRALWEGHLLYNKPEFKNIFSLSFAPFVKKLTAPNSLAEKPQIKIGMINRFKAACNTFLKKKEEVF